MQSFVINTKTLIKHNYRTIKFNLIVHPAFLLLIPGVLYYSHTYIPIFAYLHYIIVQ